MMTQLMEPRLQPSTVFVLTHTTTQAYVYTMLSLECSFLHLHQPLGIRLGEVSSVKHSLISLSQNPKGYELSYGYEEWLLMWGNSARDYKSVEYRKGTAARWAQAAAWRPMGCQCRAEPGRQVGGTAMPQPAPAAAEQKLTPPALDPKAAQSGSGCRGPFQTLVVQVLSSPRAATATLPHTTFVYDGGR